MPPTIQGHILVVDDNRMNRLKLTRGLAQEGHTITVAEDGRMALECLQQESFDLMLLDIIMPEMDGFAVLAHVKANPQLRDLPVIVISALDEIESVVKCIELGAEDHLAKPFDPILLKARINSSLEKRRLCEQVAENLNEIEQLKQEVVALRQQLGAASEE